MKDSTTAKIIGIFIILSLLVLSFMVEGCATGKRTEVIEYCATFYLYDGEVALQNARGSLRELNGFHKSTKSGYEVHTMKWDMCTMGHEVYHGLVRGGMDTENHPHFKWSKK